jgi:hypothetical protein
VCVNRWPTLVFLRCYGHAHTYKWKLITTTAACERSFLKNLLRLRCTRFCGQITHGRNDVVMALIPAVRIIITRTQSMYGYARAIFTRPKIIRHAKIGPPARCRARNGVNKVAGDSRNKSIFIQYQLFRFLNHVVNR